MPKMYWLSKIPLIVLVGMSKMLSVVSLEFSPSFSDIYAVNGRPLWWTCTAVNTGQLSRLVFAWRFQNGVIVQDGTRIAYNNGTLYFPQVLSSHYGQYTCAASDSQVAIEKTVYLRQAYVSSSILLQPGNQTVQLGGAVVLDCQVDGQPAPSLSWKVNGVDLFRTASVSITDVAAGHSILQISNASYTNSGSYTCTMSHASLSQARISSPATVVVYGRPVLISIMQDQAVPIGYNVTFNCQVNSEPKAVSVWRFRQSGSDVQIQLSSPATPPFLLIDEVNGILQLFYVNESHSGTYLCTWFNDYGSVLSQAMLTVAGQPQSPTFIIRPSDTSLVEGSDLYLSCSGSGNPTPTVFWFDPASYIISSTSVFQPTCNGDQGTGKTWSCPGNYTHSSDRVNRAVTNSTGSLTLKNMSSADLGVYICRLFNHEGFADSFVFVNVLYKPYFTTVPQSMTVNEGSQIVLSCFAVGNPQPVISWTLPGSSTLNLTSTNAGSNLNKNEIVMDNGDLNVSQISNAYQGIFTCYASNSIGSVSAAAAVVVIGVPHFSVIPVSQGVIEGDKVILQCRVDIDTLADVSWYYRYILDPSMQSSDIQQLKESLTLTKTPVDSMTLLQPGQNTRFSVINGTSLLCDDVEKSDAGIYLCLATNSQGSAFAPAILRVITYPEFQVSPNNTRAVLGSTVRLDCFCVGIPVPSQRWIFNGKKVEMNTGKSLYVNGSLLINSLEESDFGNYTCLATNQAGQRSVSAMVTLSMLPYFLSRPFNVTSTPGEKAVLSCRGQSRTSFKVLWYISDAAGNPLHPLGQTVFNANDGQEINPNKDTSRVGNRTHITPEGDLAFDCVENSDSLWYSCVLQNLDGSTASNPVFLVVNDLPFITAFDTPDKTFTGQAANMSCQSGGSPVPVISWISPVKLEYTSSSVGNITVVVTLEPQLVKSILTISNLNIARDAGVWTCKACNSVGCRIQKATLILEGGVVIRQIISDELENEYTISCVAAGVPAPSVTYSSEGIPIGNDTEGHNVANATLWIQKSKLLHEYTCQASNFYGSHSVVLSVPQNISILTVRPLSYGLNVSLNYSEPIPYLSPNNLVLRYTTEGSNSWQVQKFLLSGKTEDYFQVENGAISNNETVGTCDDLSENIVKRDLSDTATSAGDMKISVISTGSFFVYSIVANLSNLQPNTAYVLQATLANIIGSGSYSSQVSAKTLAAPPSPVTNPNVIVFNKTAAVRWTKPNPINGLPQDTFILVHLYNSSSNTTFMNETSVSVLDNQQVIFYNLQQGKYTLQIIVTNRQTNTASSIVTAAFTVEDRPPLYNANITRMRALNSHTVELEWTTPPDLNSINPAVTGYAIEIYKIEQNNNSSYVDRLILNISGASVSYWKIDSLAEQTMYSIRVASQNSAGTGPYSEARNITTPSSDDSIPWETIVIIVVVICVIIIIIIVIVIVIYKRKKVNKNNSGSARPSVEDHESTPNVQEEMQHDDVSRVVEGHENEGYIMY